MKALFELFRRFDARRIFGFIRRLGGMSRPKVKCYDLRSTRALRVEGDQVIRVSPAGRIDFYPRPPGGGRPQTVEPVSVEYFVFLSTPSGWRATVTNNGKTVLGGDFYPRPPGGGRHCHFCSSFYAATFLSTPSGWRATTLVERLFWMRSISIHALRVEGDFSAAV